MRYVTVVLIKESVVSESFIFVGTGAFGTDADRELGKRAEAKFCELAAEHGAHGTSFGPCWGDFTVEDIEDTLDDGYISFGNGYSLCITWPTTEEEMNDGNA